MFIYLTTNKVNGKKYIGKSVKPEHHHYLGSGLYLKRAIKKYGKENFERVIIERCNAPQQLRSRETYWIDKYDASNSDDFYNISSLSGGGHHGRDQQGDKNPMFGKKHPNHVAHFGKDNGMHGSKRTLSENPNAKTVTVEAPDGQVYNSNSVKELCISIFGNDKNYTKMIHMIRQYNRGIIPRKGSTFYKWKGKYK